MGLTAHRNKRTERGPHPLLFFPDDWHCRPTWQWVKGHVTPGRAVLPLNPDSPCLYFFAVCLCWVLMLCA